MNAPLSIQRVLVLGGSGHIGQRWLEQHARYTSGPVAWEAWSGSRQAAIGQPRCLRVDVRDAASLAAAVDGMDAVVNCVAGSGPAMAEGMAHLCAAALPRGVRVVHLSTQSVYGPFEGTVQESMPLDPRLGWYGRAKCEAEMQLREFVRRGGQAVVLRPGCVFGPGSHLWVGRIAQWLARGRLGELGEGGDGWSNVVHVDDVGLAIGRALQLPLGPGQLTAFNLAAPDSPRWNTYFTDLALALGTPLARPPAWRLWLDSHLASPPLKAAQALWQRLGGDTRTWPTPLPPGVVRLWSQQMRLDASAASQTLGLRWTPYATALADSVRWLAGRPGLRQGGQPCTS